MFLHCIYKIILKQLVTSTGSEQTQGIAQIIVKLLTLF